jgi:hypothetical protein
VRRASSHAAVARSLRKCTPDGCWRSARQYRSTVSITTRGFWLVVMLSRYTSGLPHPLLRSGNLRMRSTSNAVDRGAQVAVVVISRAVLMPAPRLPRLHPSSDWSRASSNRSSRPWSDAIVTG